MTTHAPLAVPTRTSKRGRTNPLTSGLPDPRPLTDYVATYSEPGGGKSRITIALKQPCIIRSPQWTFIDCATGLGIVADLVTPSGNTTIVFDFDAIIAGSIAFVDVPYQDTQVQNFQGGFVRPGGQWFRSPK